MISAAERLCGGKRRLTYIPDERLDGHVSSARREPEAGVGGRQPAGIGTPAEARHLTQTRVHVSHRPGD